MWLAAWKLVSNDAKRTVAPPNAKHSTLLKGCFLCFCFCAPNIYPLNPFQRNATTSNCPLNAKSHPAGMHICYAIFAGISLRLCSISLRSLRITFAAYLPTHIKFLTEFHRIFFGTTCISFPNILSSGVFRRERRAVFILGAMW